jgi:cation transporter-like permease
MQCIIGEAGSWLLSPPTAPTAANCFSCNTYLFASLLTYFLLYLRITIVALLITRGGAVGGTATWVLASLLTYYSSRVKRASLLTYYYFYLGARFFTYLLLLLE